MADVDDDKLTPGQGNPDEPETPTGQEAELEPEEPEAGKAAEGEPGDEAPAAGAEGEEVAIPKSRSERRHERYIDKLSEEIRNSPPPSGRYLEDLFSPAKSYEPLKYQEGEEIDPKVIEEDRAKAADAARAEGLRQGTQQGASAAAQQATLENFETRLDIDKDRVAAKWDALDPEKGELYKPKLEQYLVQQYIAFTGMEKDPTTGRITIARPNIRFRDFVDAEMQNMEDYAAGKSAQSSKNVAAQAAKTGVRPTGQGRPSKGGHGFDPNDPAGSVARMTSEQYFKLGGKEASDAYLADKGLGAKV